MDTFELKKTPIKGVYELGKLDPVFIEHNNFINPDPRVIQLLNFIGLDENVFLGARHSFNPQSEDRDSATPVWHVDSYDRSVDGMCKPSKVTSHMIICIYGKQGTWFRYNRNKIWKSPPWTILLTRRDAVHASPNKYLECIDGDRRMTRFNIRKSAYRRIPNLINLLYSRGI